MITLKTLEQASVYDVFSQAKNHLLFQYKAARGDLGNCSYRVVEEDGTVLKCAAGCFIADDEYKKEMDRQDDTSWGELVIRGMVPSKHADLITELQNIHDSFEPRMWEMRLLELEARLEEFE